MGEINRREFMSAAALAAAFACVASCPLLAVADDEKGAKLDIGPKTNFAADGIVDKWIKSDKVVVARHDGKLYAFTAICTHRGGTVTPRGGQLECNRHHARFDVDGMVTRGPADASLVHFGISVNDAGHVIVDTTQTFTDDQWKDPASFVSVEDKKDK